MRNEVLGQICVFCGNFFNLKTSANEVPRLYMARLLYIREVVVKDIISLWTVKIKHLAEGRECKKSRHWKHYSR